MTLSVRNLHLIGEYHTIKSFSGKLYIMLHVFVHVKVYYSVIEQYFSKSLNQ